MNRKIIEEKARALQFEIWHQRAILFPWGEPSLQKMFRPEVAARVLQLEIDYQADLGTVGIGKAAFTIAGILDRTRGVISISNRFNEQAMRFTGAHEVGHFMLHPGERLHRDRPLTLGDIGHGRSPIEREADYFAACFLAPRKLNEQEFELRFGNWPLHLNDTVAYYLMGEKVDELMGAPSGSLDFATAVSAARRFNGRRFASLADCFGISINAMAIRLQELGLVDS